MLFPLYLFQFLTNFDELWLDVDQYEFKNLFTSVMEVCALCVPSSFEIKYYFKEDPK